MSSRFAIGLNRKKFLSVGNLYLLRNLILTGLISVIKKN